MSVIGVGTRPGVKGVPLEVMATAIGDALGDASTEPAAAQYCPPCLQETASSCAALDDELSGVASSMGRC
ncbi:MAG TPA: hypothetical protein VMD59_23075, partial [Acidimicrobiales bacterium]|nr:hypothetical protein [Acidimicrobiales bacterium]